MTVFTAVSFKATHTSVYALVLGQFFQFVFFKRVVITITYSVNNNYLGCLDINLIRFIRYFSVCGFQGTYVTVLSVIT